MAVRGEVRFEAIAAKAGLADEECGVARIPARVGHRTGQQQGVAQNCAANLAAHGYQNHAPLLRPQRYGRPAECAFANRNRYKFVPVVQRPAVSAFVLERSGRGGGDRNCIPTFQVQQRKRRSTAAPFQLEPFGANSREVVYPVFV